MVMAAELLGLFWAAKIPFHLFWRCKFAVLKNRQTETGITLVTNLWVFPKRERGRAFISRNNLKRPYRVFFFFEKQMIKIISNFKGLREKIPVLFSSYKTTSRPVKQHQ